MFNGWLLVFLLMFNLEGREQTVSYPTLEAEAYLGSSDPSESADPSHSHWLKISSSAVFSEVTDEFLAKLESLQRKFGERIPRPTTIHLYTQTFQNLGVSRIKVNLSGYEMVNSPMLEVAQDFSFILEPGASKTIKFLAMGEVEVRQSYISFGTWDYQENRWHFIGMKASFWLPPVPSLFLEVK